MPEASIWFETTDKPLINGLLEEGSIKADGL